MGLTGGQFIAAQLAREGVNHCFGIVDGTYVGLYRALPENGIDLISPRHESSAAHMAGAYARISGSLGVCMASNGPGVANVLPGVAVENAEGNRVLLITSARRRGIGYPDRGGTYQYLDHVGVTRPMCKWSGHVSEPGRLPELLRRALRTSFRGRPGVVHLDVPEDLINGDCGLGEADVREPSSYRPVGARQPDPAAIERIAGRLRAAERPLIQAGSGVLHAGAEAELAQLAELLEAAVVTSWGGRGVLSETAPQAIPMVHVDEVDRARNEADAVLIVGSRVGETDWWGKAPNWAPPEGLPAFQIDLDEDLIGLNRPVEASVVADARTALAALCSAISESGSAGPLESRRAWLAGLRNRCAADRRKLDKPLGEAGEGDGPVHPAYVASTCGRVMPAHTIWVFDGGNTAVWANFHHTAVHLRSLLQTFKFGMLGAGVGQALGAQVAEPGRPVCCLIGDGAMGMHPQEVETAVRHGLPVVWVVFSDRQWGMVKMSQQIAVAPVRTVARKVLFDKPLPEGETIYADLGEIAWDDMARAMGAHGERVSAPRDLEPALRRAAETDGPAVVHVDVDPAAHMWAPGLRTFKKMHEEPSG